MSNVETIEQNRRSWDTISAAYQAERRISVDDVHYGPFAPGERELKLLGDGPEGPPQSVQGKRVLEVGCGGGQNAVALARWGAKCAGVDPSTAQVAHARRLAREQGVEVEFVVGVAEDLGAFPDAGFDLVLSSYAFDYVANLAQAYREAWRVLKPGGLFVFCLSHPWFQAVGWYLAGDPDMPEVADYAAWPIADDWDWSFEDGTTAAFRDHLRPLAQIVNELIEAGFALERLVEQPYEVAAGTPAGETGRFPYVYELDPDSPEYVVARKLPRTLIVRARKGAGSAA
jgi:SAM-dependent methyltransferase